MTALVLVAPLARAAEPDSVPHSEPAAEAAPEQPFSVTWRRFGVWDYAATAVVGGIYASVELGLSDPSKAHWTKPLPLDRSIRDLVVADTRAAREQADRLSDYLWYGSTAYPVVVSAVVPPLRGGGWDMVLQLQMMNLESYLVASLVTRLPHKLVGRQRPNALGCEDNPEYDAQCGTKGQNQSFFSGHAAISMTGAGLACAHHLHAELYGGGWPDAAACGTALAAATTVAYLRQRADRHWTSDSLVGLPVGFLSGYVLPTVLYYHPFWRDESPRSRASAAVRQAPRGAFFGIVPALGPQSASVIALGVF